MTATHKPDCTFASAPGGEIQGEIQCQFIFSGKNDELTLDFPRNSPGVPGTLRCGRIDSPHCPERLQIQTIPSS